MTRFQLIRAERVSNGLCAQCGTEPHKPGRVTGERCMRAARARTRALCNAYYAVGLCRCGREPDGGLSDCKRCRNQKIGVRP